MLRIIGGELRGRKILYSGDERTRPMKDRVREAVFNLVGPAVGGALAIDLFAGSGALGFEALSRGARRAVFLEQHFPTAALVRQNAATLGVSDRVEVHAANTFIWIDTRLPAVTTPWLVFCSPPYRFYVDRQAEMVRLIDTFVQKSPPNSTIIVEFDRQFDTAKIPAAESWDIREYLPAVVAVYRQA